MAPTRAQLLADRALDKAPTDAWVQWAVNELLAGQDSPHLRILAGERPPFDPFEISALLDKVLSELAVAVPSRDKAMLAYAAELADTLVKSQANDVAPLRQLRDLCIESGYPKYLYNFYLLAFAEQDLQAGGVQFYWLGATPANIRQLILDCANEWLGEF